MSEIYYAYQITNTVDDLTYVGSTKVSLKTRMVEHKCVAKRSKAKLYKHMKELGFYRFNIELLDSRNCCSVEEARMFEQEMIDAIKPELNTNRSHSTAEIKHEKTLQASKRRWAKYKNVKIECSCGKSYSVNGKTNHLRTKTHRKYLETEK